MCISLFTYSKHNNSINIVKQEVSLSMKDKKDLENERLIDSYDYLSNAASSWDCTGLIPSEPISTGELESYEDLYHFLPPNGKASNLKPEEKDEQTK